MLADKILLTWGNYFNYPKCCILAFLSKTNLSSGSVFEGSGFKPCNCCAEKVKGLSFSEANKKLGLNVKVEHYSDPVQHAQAVLDKVQSSEFISIATDVGMSVKQYANYVVSLGVATKPRQGISLSQRAKLRKEWVNRDE